MAAYAALLSLANVLDDILHPDNPHHFPFHMQQIESLHEKLSFLLESLENDAQDWGGGALSPLEMKVRDAVHEAEDTIESLIRDHFHSKSQSHGGGDLSVEHHDLEKIIEEIDSIKKEVMQMIDSRESGQPRDNPSVVIGSSRRPTSQIEKNSMVGFHDEFLKMKERVVSGSLQQPSLQIIPIVGMGGSGKTTFATRVYNNPEIQKHFDILAMTKLTQNYDVGEIALDLLQQIPNPNLEMQQASDEDQTPEIHQSDDVRLQEDLYQRLKGRRYLIVMDDVWSKKTWDDFSRCFQDDYTGSRILLTTRLTNVADYVNSYRHDHHQMRLLRIDESWKLLHEKVFGDESCPPELKKIGQEIVEKCQGLPLAVVTISGLLSKANRRQDIWEDIDKKIRSIAVTDKQFSDLLMLSYNNLPYHLKVCFLYMGILFLQNKEIHVSRLFELWEAEGFLKTSRSTTLKTVAEDYLRDLVERNLILVIRKGSNGKITRCGIHDLLRDLCVKIGQMENVLCVHNKEHFHGGVPSGKDTPRRVIITSDLTRVSEEYSLDVRSLIVAIHFHNEYALSRYYSYSKLMRVFDASQLTFNCFPEEILELVNLRYLDFRSYSTRIPSSICRLWALKTLILRERSTSPSLDYLDPYCLPQEIWGMPRLKHIHVHNGYRLLPVPTEDIKKDLVSRTSLETLPLLINFELNEEVVRRLANLKKVKLLYKEDASGYELGISNLHNLVRLGKLETLSCSIVASYSGKWLGLKRSVVERLAFPKTLKKLTLYWCGIPWEYMTIIGSLPVLQVLNLKDNSFVGKVWEPVEGQFCELKFLLLSLLDLEEWRAENSHFPNLERLIVKLCRQLKRIPKGIGDIPTLKVMELDYCNSSAEASVEEIRDDLQELGIDGLQINISRI